MVAILPPNPSLRGGGGKYFLNLYPMYCLNSKLQVPSTKIGGPALKRGQFYPQNPSLRGGGGKYFLNVYPMYSLNSEFQVPNTKIGGPALKRG